MDEVTEIRIRHLPIETHELYKDRAKRNYRSVNAQLIVDLAELANQEYAQQQAEGAE